MPLSLDPTPARSPGTGASPVPILVVGEALVDVIADAADDGWAVRRHVGGSPANVAIGLARLGHDVRLATRIGRDPDGDLVGAHLRHEGVALTAGSIADGPTSTARATLDTTGAAEYAFDIAWDPPPIDLGDAGLANAGHLHTGSIAATLGPGAAAVGAALRDAVRAGLTTSYDPNARPRIMGSPEVERPGIERLVAAGDVVKASDEDLAWLYPGEPVEAVLARWLAAGPALVVLTRGARGATATLATDPQASVDVPQHPVRVVDTVGAGDAFMAGLLSGLADAGLLGGPAARQALRRAGPDAVRPALDRAARAASITCGRAGAQPPYRRELAATSS
jgi:fructokinase